MIRISIILFSILTLNAKAQSSPPIRSLSEAIATIEANSNRDMQIYRETITQQNRNYLLNCRVSGLTLQQCRRELIDIRTRQAAEQQSQISSEMLESIDASLKIISGRKK